MSEGYRVFEHTGDLGLEVWAADAARLHGLAAVALQAQMFQAREDAPPPPPRELERRLALEGQDAADLLVHWLNTTLLESELAHAVWTRAEIRSLDRRALAGTVAGPPRDRARHVYLREIKAVSHHALELSLEPGACRCRLILDL